MSVCVCMWRGWISQHDLLSFPWTLCSKPLNTDEARKPRAHLPFEFYTWTAQASAAEWERELLFFHFSWGTQAQVQKGMSGACSSREVTQECHGADAECSCQLALRVEVACSCLQPWDVTS